MRDPTSSPLAGTPSKPGKEAEVTPKKRLVDLPLAAPPVAGWGERWRAWRDRTVASAGFQRWAAAFPLTRPIARRRALKTVPAPAHRVTTHPAPTAVPSAPAHSLRISTSLPKPT